MFKSPFFIALWVKLQVNSINSRILPDIWKEFQHTNKWLLLWIFLFNDLIGNHLFWRGSNPAAKGCISAIFFLYSYFGRQNEVIDNLFTQCKTYLTIEDLIKELYYFSLIFDIKISQLLTIHFLHFFFLQYIHPACH